MEQIWTGMDMNLTLKSSDMNTTPSVIKIKINVTNYILYVYRNNADLDVKNGNNIN